MTGVTAAIPYETFPDLVSIGSIQLRTFGLAVGLGVLIGAMIAGKYAERYGIDRQETYRLATRLVVAGVVGARISWDLSHWDEINSPIDLIAVWKGGLQFSGGFLAAILVGLPTFRKWSRLARWRMIDGLAFGLSIGLAFGRIGCTSVGEHFGSTWGASWFPLMVRFEGGSVRESTLGNPGPQVADGLVFHQTAIYELLYLVVIFVVLWRVLRRNPPVAPGTGMGLFCLLYGLSRLGTDFLRINDKTVLGLTGAQYLMIGISLASIWILFSVRPATAALQAAEAAEAADADAPPDTTDEADPEPEPEPEPEPANTNPPEP